MITAIVAFALAAQGQDRPKPGDLVTRMLAHYSEANTLAGTLTYEQDAKDSNGRALLDSSGRPTKAAGKTVVQIERPNKLFIQQTVTAADNLMARIVSDGNAFLYSVPATFGDKYKELREPIQQNGQVLTVGDIYNIGGAGLIIKPVPLDIAIARRGDLEVLRTQIVNVDDQGDDKIDGQTVHLVGGDLREYDSAPPSAKYQFAITDAGDLVRYSTKELVDPDPIKHSMKPVEVDTVWTVDLKVNGQVDENLFKDKGLSPNQAGGGNGG